MRTSPNIAVIIPTLNEEVSIGVRRAIDPARVASRIIVADGGSSDATVAQARRAGAEVIAAGAATGAPAWRAPGMADDADILVFMDGDGADDPAASPRWSSRSRRARTISSSARAFAASASPAAWPGIRSPPVCWPGG